MLVVSAACNCRKSENKYIKSLYLFYNNFVFYAIELNIHPVRLSKNFSRARQISRIVTMPISKTQRMTWALLFLFLGGLWSGMIYTRCHRHSSTEIVTEQQSEPMQKIRSPFVKWYHVFLFWFVVYLEVICAAFYVVGGIAVGRNYPFTKVAILSAFILDLIYKVLTAVYMNFCAIPIQHATQNQNVLEVLYTPDETPFSKIYAYLSGIKVYQPGGWIYGILYLGFLIYGIYFFSQVQFPLRNRRIEKT